MNSTLKDFSSKETWHGGSYEIEFELGSPSDERLRMALQTVWSHPSLEGCYLNREQEPRSQVRVNPREHAIESHLYGIASLPNGATAACGTYACRLRDEKEVPLRDLLAFYVPLGSLVRTYTIGGYPFSDVDRAVEWRPQLDE